MGGAVLIGTPGLALQFNVTETRARRLLRRWPLLISLLGVLLWLLAGDPHATLLGVTLLGETKEEASSISTGTGKIIGVQFECTTEGTLEELHIIPSKAWAGTKAYLGIAEDSAGAPGTLLAKAESTSIPAEKVAYALGGFSVHLNLHSKYWLLAKAGTTLQAGTLLGKAAGTGTVRLSTKTFNTIETTNEWEAAVTKGPLSFWGTGTESVATGNPMSLLV